MYFTGRFAFAVMVLALSAWPATVDGRGGGSSRGGMRMESPPAYVPVFDGRMLRRQACEPGEPFTLTLILDPGYSYQQPNRPAFKTIFQPGDLTIAIQRVIRNGTRESTKTVIEFDPVQAAFEAYRKTHPKARVLPTPADAWAENVPVLAPGWRDALVGSSDASAKAGTEIPIKALVADGDEPDAPRTEITCGAMPQGIAEPNWYSVTVTYRGITPEGRTPLSPGQSPLRIFPSDSPDSEMTLARDAAAVMMEYQARKELRVDTVAVVKPIRLVDLADPVGMHYDATYAAPDGRIVNIGVLGRRGNIPTVSINGGPARWPATQPAVKP